MNNEKIQQLAPSNSPEGGELWDVQKSTGCNKSQSAKASPLGRFGGALRFRGSFFLLLFLPLSLNAQLLWRIEGNNLSAPSYLFGTHHLIPVDFLESHPQVLRAFTRTQTVIGEIAMYRIEASEQIMRASMLPQGVTMENLLTEEDWLLVDLELRSTIQMGLRELGMMRPMAINMLYTVALYSQTAEIAGEVQLDSYFQMLALQADKRIIGLETVEQQMEVLFGSSLEREAEMLVKTVRLRNETVAGIKELNRLYKAGKLDELMKMAQNQDSPTAMTAEEFARLNCNRNHAWMEILPDLMRESPSFIAVGALHLPGENGLINLLRRQGFRVSEVRNDAERRRRR